MKRIERGELALQKFRYDNINPRFNGAEVPFILAGSPDSSADSLELPFIEMDWNPGTASAVGTDARTFQYEGVLTFYIFMPKGLNPIAGRNVLADIEESCSYQHKDYPECTVTFGRTRSRPTRTVATADMTVLEVDTNLILR